VEQVLLALPVSLASVVQRDLPEPRVLLVLKVHPDHREHRGYPDPLDSLDQLEQLDHPVHPVHKAILDPRVILGHQVHLDSRVLRVPLE